MAVWQFTLMPLPNAIARRGNVHLLRVENAQERGEGPALSPVDAEALFEAISQVLPEKRSWSTDLRVWGDEEFSDIQVWRDGLAIESIKIRLDLRSRSIQLIDRLCRLAISQDWSFATVTGEVVPATRSAIVRAAMASDAQRFIDDPEGFLAEALRMDESE